MTTLLPYKIAVLLNIYLRTYKTNTFHYVGKIKVDSSVPTILPARVRVPSSPSMLLSVMVNFAPYLSCEKNENKQKEAGFGPFYKEKSVIIIKEASFKRDSTFWPFEI